MYSYKINKRYDLLNNLKKKNESGKQIIRILIYDELKWRWKNT